MDIKGAYDSLNLTILENKLIEQFSVPRHISRSITNLYRTREIYVRNYKNRKIGPQITSLGLPQGSVLSPLLFNLYTADVHGFVDVDIIQYADDFCMFIEHKKYDMSLELLSNAYIRLREWFINNGFEISIDKTVISTFTRHNTPSCANIKISDDSFAHRNQVKYLGVILDKKLTWKWHIEHISLKCTKGFNFLRSIARTWWGADVKASLLFYKSYIRSILDYASIFYHSAAQTTLKVIDRMQYKTLRYCVGAMKTTPTQALLVEALEASLHLRREYLGFKFLMKHISLDTPLANDVADLNIYDLTNKYWRLKTSPLLCSIYRENTSTFSELKSITISDIDYFSMIADIPTIVPVFIDIPSINKVILNSHLSSMEDTLLIYTDASKTQEGCGCAIYVPQKLHEEIFKLNSKFTIYTCEAYAIYEALKYAETQEIRHVTILSDSLSVICGLQNLSSLS